MCCNMAHYSVKIFLTGTLIYRAIIMPKCVLHTDTLERIVDLALLNSLQVAGDEYINLPEDTDDIICLFIWQWASDLGTQDL